MGKIIFIATAADAASSTLRIRVELPNKAKRPSGEHVIVNFGGTNGDVEAGLIGPIRAEQ